MKGGKRVAQAQACEGEEDAMMSDLISATVLVPLVGFLGERGRQGEGELW